MEEKKMEYKPEGNYWYRAPSESPLEDIIIFCLAVAMPFLIWGAKAKLEGKFKESNQIYKSEEQRQVYDVNRVLNK